MHGNDRQTVSHLKSTNVEPSDQHLQIDRTQKKRPHGDMALVSGTVDLDHLDARLFRPEHQRQRIALERPPDIHLCLDRAQGCHGAMKRGCVAHCGPQSSKDLAADLGRSDEPRPLVSASQILPPPRTESTMARSVQSNPWHNECSTGGTLCLSMFRRGNRMCCDTRLASTVGRMPRRRSGVTTASQCRRSRQTCLMYCLLAGTRCRIKDF